MTRLSQIFFTVFTFDDIKNFARIVHGGRIIAFGREAPVTCYGIVFVFTPTPKKG